MSTQKFPDNLVRRVFCDAAPQSFCVFPDDQRVKWRDARGHCPQVIADDVEPRWVPFLAWDLLLCPGLPGSGVIFTSVSVFLMSLATSGPNQAEAAPPGFELMLRTGFGYSQTQYYAGAFLPTSQGEFGLLFKKSTPPFDRFELFARAIANGETAAATSQLTLGYMLTQCCDDIAITGDFGTEIEEG